MLYDCQTQSGTAAFARTRFIHTVKALEDPRQMFGSDARTEVAHKKLNAVFVLIGPDDNFLAVLGIAQGIADEVAKNLMYDIAIHRHLPI
jgi:hypothetical protein